MAVQPDHRSYERYKAENGWYDVTLATIGPYELVQQPADPYTWYLIDTRQPRTRDNRHPIHWRNRWCIRLDPHGVDLRCTP